MLAQKLIFGYSSRIIIQVIQIAATIVVARVAGPSVLGTVAFGLAYVNMFLTFSDLGLGTAHIKYLSEGQDSAKCLGTFVPLKLMLILAYILVVTGFFAIQKWGFNSAFESRDHIVVIFILLGAISLEQLFAIPKTTFAAFTQVARSELPDLIKTFFYQILRIIIVLLGFRAIGLALGNLIAVIFIVPVYWYMFKGYEIGRFDKSLAQKYIKLALPIMALGFSTKLTSTIDKVFLQFFTDSVTVGHYTAAFRFGSFVLMIGTIVTSIFFPAFSGAFAANNVESIRRNLYKFERFSFIFIMPFVILVTLNTDLIVTSLLGDQYLKSIPIMKIVNAAMFMMLIILPFGAVITGKGKFNTAAFINAGNFLVYFILLVVAVHPSGLNMAGVGAATALLVTYSALGILYRIFASNILGGIKNYMTVFFIAYGLGNYLVFSYLINYQIIPHLILFRLLFSVCYVFLTFLSLFLLRMIKKEDLNLLHTLFDFAKLKEYILNEIKK